MDVSEKRLHDYRNKIFSTILEGCQLSEPGNEPQYHGLELVIPENVKCLVYPESQFRFLLYARNFNVSQKVEIPRNMKGGFPIPSFSLVYECPRSFITRDGRVYITKQAFDYSRHDYTEGLVPIILKDSQKIFEQGLTPEEVLQKNKA